LLWQRISSFLVVSNLLVNIAQSQALPIAGSRGFAIFDALDITFTSVRKRDRGRDLRRDRERGAR
jgi:hypothetical protein